MMKSAFALRAKSFKERSSPVHDVSTLVLSTSYFFHSYTPLTSATHKILELPFCITRAWLFVNGAE